MAKLYNYFVLCPLIDKNSFLGVSPDKNEQSVIVTLARNIVNIYRLTDQKQIGGWATKEHLTAAVIYDPELDQYVGVFNRNMIKLWDEQMLNLDKLRKYKFGQDILRILPRENQSALIIFTNGSCVSLSHAISNTKIKPNKNIVKENNEIVDAVSCTIQNTEHICFVVKDASDKYEILTCPLSVEAGECERARLRTVAVRRDEGSATVDAVLALRRSVFILWSDSQLSSYEFSEDGWRSAGVVSGILGGGGAVLAWLGARHVLVLGESAGREGARLVLHDAALGVSVHHHPMKMFARGAVLRCVHHHILHTSASHLAALRYRLQSHRALSALLPVTPATTATDADPGPLLTALERGDWEAAQDELARGEGDEAAAVAGVRRAVRALAPPLDEWDEARAERWHAGADRGALGLLHYALVRGGGDVALAAALRRLDADEALAVLALIAWVLRSPRADCDARYERHLLRWAALLADGFHARWRTAGGERATRVLTVTRAAVRALLADTLAVDRALPELERALRSRHRPRPVDDCLSYSIELI